MKNGLIRRCAALVCVFIVCVSASLAMEQVQPDMLEIDHKLYELGYRDENCNGELDDVTICALQNFQKVNGLAITGQPDEQTVALLMSDAAVGARQYLVEFSGKYGATVLTEGASGAEVVKLQQALKESGYFSGECDGNYGAATAVAVYRFQTANGLERTGAAGSPVFLRLYEGSPITWEEFLSRGCAGLGDSSAQVRQIQLRLKYLGYFNGESSGNYGELTGDAVRRFQEKNDLDPTGEVDVKTYAMLFADDSVAAVNPASIKRGSRNSMLDLIYSRLSRLGYPANEAFSYRMELGVLAFQKINGMEVSGIVDQNTLACLQVEEALGLSAALEQEPDAQQVRQLYPAFAHTALSMLGQTHDFESALEFAQYVYLKGGAVMMHEMQIMLEPVTDRSTIAAGEALWLDCGQEPLAGIATADQALIYAGKDGHIVMTYLDMLAPEEIFRWQMEADDAA